MTETTEMKTAEVFIAMNEDGDYVVVADESDALTKLGEDVGGYQGRVVKITVKMMPPKLTEAEVTVPDDAGSTSPIETEAV